MNRINNNYFPPLEINTVPEIGTYFLTLCWYKFLKIDQMDEAEHRVKEIELDKSPFSNATQRQLHNQ